MNFNNYSSSVNVCQSIRAGHLNEMQMILSSNLSKNGDVSDGHYSNQNLYVQEAIGLSDPLIRDKCLKTLQAYFPSIKIPFSLAEKNIFKTVPLDEDVVAIDAPFEDVVQPELRRQNPLQVRMMRKLGTKQKCLRGKSIQHFQTPYGNCVTPHVQILGRLYESNRPFNADTLQPNWDHPLLDFHAYPPLENNAVDLNSSHLQQWLAANPNTFGCPFSWSELIEKINYVDFATFKASLDVAVLKFNESIGDEPYILWLSPNLGKSTNWIVKLAQESLAHPPTWMTSDKDAIDSIAHDTGIKHVLVMDDASYSGIQLNGTVELLSSREKTHQMHAVVPFVTNHALQLLRSSDANVYYDQIMPTTSELGLPSEKMYDLESFCSMVEGFDEYIAAAIYNEDNHKRVGTTLTYFAHKIPDALSTSSILRAAKPFDMKQSLIPNREAVPPYKSNYMQHFKSENGVITTNAGKFSYLDGRHSPKKILPVVQKVSKGNFFKRLRSKLNGK